MVLAERGLALLPTLYPRDADAVVNHVFEHLGDCITLEESSSATPTSDLTSRLGRIRCERGANISWSTRVRARVTSLRPIRLVCRAFVASATRACPRFPPRNLNGKEGVDGSSLSEGFINIPANRSFCCLPRRSGSASRVRDGYIFGREGTRGHARPNATTVQTQRPRARRRLRLAVDPERLALLPRLLTASRHSVGAGLA